MYFISDKCVVGEVGSYCQSAGCDFLFFLVSSYQTRDNVVLQFILTPPFHKSGSAPGMHVYVCACVILGNLVSLCRKCPCSRNVLSFLHYI